MRDAEAVSVPARERVPQRQRLRSLLERLGLVATRPPGNEYHAFISYSHHDHATAAALCRELERFAKPWYQAQALRVFRDEESLSVDPLETSIGAAIKDSQNFLLIGSRDAAASKWVGREVELWCQNEARGKLLLVVTDGIIAWDPEAKTFDWGASTALPPALREFDVFSEEPLWIELPWARSNEADLSVDNHDFWLAVAKLAASIRGVRTDEIASYADREHRRTVQTARLAALALLLLLVLAVAAAAIAMVKRNEAIAQRHTAVSRALASEAVSSMSAGLDQGAMAAVAAYREHATPEAASSLSMAVNRTLFVQNLLRRDGGQVHSVSLDANSTLVASGDDDGVALWQTANPRPPAKLPQERGRRRPGRAERPR